MALGVPRHIVQEIVGHSDIEVTMTIYAHAVPMGCEIAAKPVLSLVIGPGTRLGTQGVQAEARVRQGETAELFPAARRLAGTESDVPLIFGRWDSDSVPSFGAQGVTSTVPKSPEVGRSACWYCA